MPVVLTSGAAPDCIAKCSGVIPLEFAQFVFAPAAHIQRVSEYAVRMLQCLAYPGLTSTKQNQKTVPLLRTTGVHQPPHNVEVTLLHSKMQRCGHTGHVLVLRIACRRYAASLQHSLGVCHFIARR